MESCVYGVVVTAVTAADSKSSLSFMYLPYVITCNAAIVIQQPHGAVFHLYETLIISSLLLRRRVRVCMLG